MKKSGKEVLLWILLILMFLFIWIFVGNNPRNVPVSTTVFEGYERISSRQHWRSGWR